MFSCCFICVSVHPLYYMFDCLETCFLKHFFASIADCRSCSNNAIVYNHGSVLIIALFYIQNCFKWTNTARFTKLSIFLHRFTIKPITSPSTDNFFRFLDAHTHYISSSKITKVIYSDQHKTIFWYMLGQ